MDDEKQEIKDLIVKVDEINTVSEFLNDDDINEALALIVYLIGNPKIPPRTAGEYIVKLTSIYAKCKLQIRVYMSLDKSAENNVKKNVLMTLSDVILELVQALKIVAKM